MKTIFTPLQRIAYRVEYCLIGMVAVNGFFQTHIYHEVSRVAPQLNTAVYYASIPFLAVSFLLVVGYARYGVFRRHEIMPIVATYLCLVLGQAVADFLISTWLIGFTTLVYVAGMLIATGVIVQQSRALLKQQQRDYRSRQRERRKATV